MSDAMSAIGTKQTSASALHMSAIGGKADMRRTSRDICFWPLADKAIALRTTHSVTHQHRAFRVRQHLVCNAAEHNCG